MKHVYLLFLLTILIACNEKPTAKASPIPTTPFFLGTYTDSLSKGIYSGTIDSLGKLSIRHLAAASINPSYLSKSANGNFLIAVNEISNEQTVGTVESYKISNDSLYKISTQSSGGANPCYVFITPDGKVFTANYTGGNIGLHQLNAQGELSTLLDTQQHYGNLEIDLQKTPHAHSTWVDPTNGIILSTDLGTNQLWASKLTPKGDQFDSRQTTKIDFDSGAGPRHIAAHPKQPWIYIVNELNSTITRIERSSADEYLKKETVSSLPNTYTKQSYGADIHLSKDGMFLYSSNRGHNSIAIFSIDQESGVLSLKATESVRGDWPRNFALSPDQQFLIVANQRSKNLVSFRRDPISGLLTFIDDITAPNPVCILF